MEIYLWFLRILQSLLKNDDLMLLDSMSNIFYLHDRDYSDLDLSEHYSKEIVESAQIFWSIAWEYDVEKTSYWYLEANFSTQDFLWLVTAFLDFFEWKNTDEKKLLEKRDEFLEKYDLWYLY